jgi:UDP-glucose:(heptosyl)LPS alpha-1,3-glucosyltransferase
MKLGFLIYSYFPFGGQQRDFLRIANECCSRQHQVTVYALRWQGPVPEGIELVLVPVKALSRLQLYRRYTEWVSAALASNPVDAVIGFNKMPLLDIYFGADACFAEKAHKQRAAYYRLTPRYRHFMAYEEAVFGAQSHSRSLLLSPRQRQGYLDYYPASEARLYELPPGISLDRRVQQRDLQIRHDLRKELNIAESELLILQIGSGFRIKGVDRSIRALAALPEVLAKRIRYLLIGQDKPARYRRLAQRLGIGDKVTILSGRDDVPRFLAAADLLLHPAYLESAGYTLLEATIAGLPVLTTASCGYAFHIEQADSGEVCAEPFQQAELNSRLRNMLENLNTAQWSANGLAYGKNPDLYRMPQVAADLIEQIATSNTGVEN